MCHNYAFDGCISRFIKFLCKKVYIIVVPLMKLCWRNWLILVNVNACEIGDTGNIGGLGPKGASNNLDRLVIELNIDWLIVEI